MSASPLERLDRLPRWPWHRLLLLNLGGSFFFGFYDIVVVGGALPVIGDQFGESSSRMAWIVTANLIGLVLGEFAGAWMASRYSRVRTLQLALFVFSVGMVISALAPSFWILLIGRFLAGLGTGADIAIVVTYIAEISPSRMRGRITGFTTVCGYTGIAVVPFLSAWLLPIGDWGWRILFGIGAFGAVLLVVTRRHMPPSPRLLQMKGQESELEELVSGAEARVRAKVGDLPPVVPLPTDTSPPRWKPLVLVIFSIAWIAYYFGNYGWLVVAPTILTNNGFSLVTSLGFIAIANLGLVLGAVLSYLIADRFERKWLLIANFSIWVLALAGIAALGTGTAFTALGFIAGMTIGFGVPTFYAFTAEHVPSRVRPLGMAFTDGIGHLGGAAAPLVLVAFAIPMAFGYMALSGVIVVVLLFLVSATRRRSLEQIAS